jgi:DNA replication protein DnaC
VKRLGPPLADEATRRHQIHLDFMAAVLLAEVDDRDERRRLRRVKDAGFPRTKRLADFDFAQSRSVIPATITTLDGGV